MGSRTLTCGAKAAGALGRLGRLSVWVMGAGIMLAADCSTEEEQRSRFNQDDVFDVAVGEQLLPAATVALSSTTGSVDVGQAELTPGGGPAGTLHTLEVWVSEDYAGQVDAASVLVDSGERGSRTLELIPDSADERLYWLELQSIGEEGEERTDTFTIQLWDVAESTETDLSQ